MKKFGYIRCSTAKSQGRQDTARQKRDIKDIAHSNDVVFYEDYMSGSKVNRTGYKTMLSDIEKAVEFGETDITIYCTEISRLSRSMQQLIDLIKFVEENHVRLICGSFEIDCRIIDDKTGRIDPMAEAMLQMMGVFASLERKMTIDRVNSGLDNARAKGVQLGRRKTTVYDIPKQFFKYYKQYREGQIKLTELARLCELSRNTVYKYINLIESKKK